MRISKVTTRTGDKGQTDLAKGQRISKDELRIECIGVIDEVNSFVGYAKVAITDEQMIALLESIQQQLFNIGGELSLPEENLGLVKPESVTELEDQIRAYNAELPPLKEFILPGGNEASARLHLARVMVRNAERKLVALHKVEPLPQEWLQYLNRLSDLLFVTARMLQRSAGTDEMQWRHD